MPLSKVTTHSGRYSAAVTLRNVDGKRNTAKREHTALSSAAHNRNRYQNHGKRRQYERKQCLIESVKRSHAPVAVRCAYFVSDSSTVSDRSSSTIAASAAAENWLF